MVTAFCPCKNASKCDRCFKIAGKEIQPPTAQSAIKGAQSVVVDDENQAIRQTADVFDFCLYLVTKELFDGGL